MKKRIRKTGEIVDVIAYSSCSSRMKDDYVSYIDSNGVEHPAECGLNYFWDFEDIAEETSSLETNIDWEQRRYEIAKNCIIGILGNDEMVDLAIDEGLKKNCRYVTTNIAEMAVLFADALISELKKGGEK